MLGGRRGVEIADDSVEESLDVAGRDLHGFLPGLEARQPQQVLDQPLHALRLAMNDLQEPPARVRILRIIQQRFGVTLDRGQRRAQLVRDVGDEVSADEVGFAQFGDVVHHEHRAAAGCDDGSDLGDQRPRGVARHRELEGAGLAARQRAADVFDDARVTDGLDVRMIDRALFEFQDAAGRVVDQLQPPLFIDHQHAFDHA